MSWLAFVAGLVLGAVLEHRFDLLKPKHVRSAERQVVKLRETVERWMRKGD